MANHPPSEPFAHARRGPQPAAEAGLTAAAFRRPIPPRPIERYDLPHPAVPDALDGLTILHLTDLHIRRLRPGHPSITGLLDALAATPVDLVALTGDYMNAPGDEPAALRTLAAMAEAWRPRFGAFGVFGNHDTPRFARAVRAIPGIRWLLNQSAPIDGLPLRLLGATFPEDLLGTVLGSGATNRRSDEATKGSRDPDPSAPNTPPPSPQLRSAQSPTAAEGGPPSSLRRSVAPSLLPLTLVHHPTEVFAAAEFGLPLVLAGHTHGGQVRLSPRFAPHTSCELPPHLASGILRLRGTLCCVSRGLGNAFAEVRFNCPPHAPLYTLRRGPMPGADRRNADPAALRQVMPW